jgi:hypothetical protein
MAAMLLQIKCLEENYETINHENERSGSTGTKYQNPYRKAVGGI